MIIKTITVKKRTLVYGLLLLGPFYTFGQNKGKIPAAQEIVTKYFEAIGGKDKLDRVKDWTFSGKLVMNKTTTPMEIMIKGKKSKVEIESFGQKRVVATNGKVAWEINPYAKNKLIVKDNYKQENNLDFSNLIFPDSLFKTSDFSRFKVRLVKHKGKEAFKLTNAIPDTMPHSEVYIFDKASYLLVYHKVNGLFVDLSNYQLSNIGLKVPQEVVPTAQWKNALVLPFARPFEFDKVKLNSNISDQIFEVPKLDQANQEDKYAKLVAKGKVLPIDKKLSAKQIVAAYIKQHTALVNVKTTVAQGNMTLGQGSFRLAWYSKNEKARLELRVQTTQIIQAFNGKDSWELNPLKRDEPVLFENSKNRVAPINFVDKALYTSQEKKLRVEYVSREYVGDKLCHHIQLFLDEQSFLDYYIGVKDGLLYKAFDEQNEVATFFVKYKQVQTYKVPTLMIFNASENRGTVFRFDKLTFNQPIDDKIFEFPDRKKLKKDKKN
ncbi:MAG TPA: hypothetical protein DCS93_27205 [Microscillaceae bacterium]|nr:hypothetical protein [Microscillaceae bacterium]